MKLERLDRYSAMDEEGDILPLDDVDVEGIPDNHFLIAGIINAKNRRADRNNQSAVDTDPDTDAVPGVATDLAMRAFLLEDMMYYLNKYVQARGMQHALTDPKRAPGIINRYGSRKGAQKVADKKSTNVATLKEELFDKPSMTLGGYTLLSEAGYDTSYLRTVGAVAHSIRGSLLNEFYDKPRASARTRLNAVNSARKAAGLAPISGLESRDDI